MFVFVLCHIKYPTRTSTIIVRFALWMACVWWWWNSKVLQEIIEINFNANDSSLTSVCVCVLDYFRIERYCSANEWLFAVHADGSLKLVRSKTHNNMVISVACVCKQSVQWRAWAYRVPTNARTVCNAIERLTKTINFVAQHVFVFRFSRTLFFFCWLNWTISQNEGQRCQRTCGPEELHWNGCVRYWRR